MARRVVIGSDHGGFEMKNQLVQFMRQDGIDVVDVGCPSTAPVDYPVIAQQTCAELLDHSKNFDLGVVVCGTGIGISIAANKVPGIRCALCHDITTARLCREHNNANVLALGGRTTGPDTAKEILSTFLKTAFSGAERHQRRVDMLGTAVPVSSCH
ncbi:putative ribose 5-phosphate isomerase B [Paratrimastix pyriformis]|uniref:Ribose 5-phosphate isomerase B n=1 Tax=Paratrimastix pyriformis TaxID=342808 RepID=A0ABQ8UER4_9EUKA|nr:putative ribose 5-phosphate isomerase B [Paratrimastix pyriformis]|eukprot:GAFH01006140.1.p1 GENE.GAFH01006140.1~~GAFH01006140.1.p1  ORF type:complete len:156 (+),score=17.82 GAFH01006140.1:3-470(+)